MAYCTVREVPLPGTRGQLHSMLSMMTSSGHRHRCADSQRTFAMRRQDATQAELETHPCATQGSEGVASNTCCKRAAGGCDVSATRCIGFASSTPGGASIQHQPACLGKAPSCPQPAASSMPYRWMLFMFSTGRCLARVEAVCSHASLVASHAAFCRCGACSPRRSVGEPWFAQPAPSFSAKRVGAASGRRQS